MSECLRLGQAPMLMLIFLSGGRPLSILLSESLSTAVVTQHGEPSPECVPLANLRLRFSGMVRPEDRSTKGHPPLSGGQSCEASRVGRWTC